MPILRLSVQPYQAPVSERIREKDQHGLLRERVTGMISVAWSQFFAAVSARIEKTTELMKAVRLQAQAAAIATTSFALASLAPGLYRISWYARITQPATVSSELTVRVHFTEGGVSQTLSGALMNGNLTTTIGSESWLVRIDQATAVSYSTLYASVGATPMQYGVDFVVESVPVN